MILLKLKMKKSNFDIFYIIYLLYQLYFLLFIVFYPLFWLSHIDYYLKIDYKPFNRLFVTRKDELVKVTEDPFEEIQKPTNNT